MMSLAAGDAPMRGILLALLLLPTVLVAPSASAGGCITTTVGAGPLVLATVQTANPAGPPGPNVCRVGATVYQCELGAYPLTYVDCQPWIVIP
jgi:hypothetical protein